MGDNTKAVLHRCSYKKVFWKYAANLKETNVRKCDLNKDCNFIEITLPHGYSPVYLLQIFRTAFCKNTYGGLLLAIQSSFTNSYLARNTRTRSETGFKYGTVFTKFELISQLVLVFFVNKWLTARIKYLSDKFTSTQ